MIVNSNFSTGVHKFGFHLIKIFSNFLFFSKKENSGKIVFPGKIMKSFSIEVSEKRLVECIIQIYAGKIKEQRTPEKHKTFPKDIFMQIT